MPEKWTATEKPWGRGGAIGRARQNGETFNTFREEKNGRTFALKDSNNDMNIT